MNGCFSSIMFVVVINSVEQYQIVHMGFFIHERGINGFIPPEVPTLNNNKW